jgi:DNA-binding MarR family transcriptional regulator
MTTPSPGTPLTDDAQALGSRLSAAVVLFHYAVGRHLGLSAADSKALELVLRHQPVTPSTLGRLLHLSPSSTTGLIDRLEESGLVRREASPDDRRKTLVVATADSDPRLGEIFGTLGAQMGTMVARYTEAEQLVIRDYVERTIDILHEQTDRLA